MMVHDYLWIFMTVHDKSWQFMTIHDKSCLFMTVQGSSGQWITIYVVVVVIVIVFVVDVVIVVVVRFWEIYEMWDSSINSYQLRNGTDKHRISDNNRFSWMNIVSQKCSNLKRTLARFVGVFLSDSSCSCGFWCDCRLQGISWGVANSSAVQDSW